TGSFFRMIPAALHLSHSFPTRRSSDLTNVIVCCTFGLFTDGFEKFDEFYEKGYFDYVITTNLNYRTPQLLQKPWYIEGNMSKFLAAIINSLNHNVSLETVLSPTEKIQKLVKKHREHQMNSHS